MRFGRLQLTLMLGASLTALGCLGIDDGGNGNGPPPPMIDPVRFNEVDAGGAHTCALTLPGAAYCWGTNATGQLGTGTAPNPEQTPAAAVGDLEFGSISAGGTHTCAITDTGEAYCWGNNVCGAIGNGDAVNCQNQVPLIQSFPSAVAGGHTFRQISAGGGHSCGVTMDGAGLCWGLAESGRLGNGIDAARASRIEPDSVLGGLEFTFISAGGSHSCGITIDNDAYCWGDGNSGQLGIGSNTAASTPTLVSGGLKFDVISAGGQHTCGVTTISGRTAYCWGFGQNGQLGVGGPANRNEPDMVAGGLSFETVDAGGSHTCGVAFPGEAHCWGINDSGQIGDGTGADRFSPVAVAGNILFEEVTTGLQGFQTVSCGFAADLLVYCWGFGDFGQLGTLDGATTATPIRVASQIDPT